MMGQIRASRYTICKYLQDLLRCVMPEMRGVRVRRIIRRISRERRIALLDCKCVLKEKISKTFDDWHTLLASPVDLPREVATVSLTLPLLLRATKWLIVQASCVVYINSGRT
jgi:hypothetical protein